MNKLLILSVCLLLLTGCADDAGTDTASVDSEVLNSETPGSEIPSATTPALASGVELENFNTDIKPGDDFYRYVNGTWLSDTAIPADRSNYGAFTMLAEEAEENLRGLIEEAAFEDAAPGSEAQKVGDFYNSFMALDTIEELGVSPLQALLDEVAAVESKEALLLLSAELNRIGVQMPVGAFIDVDAKQSDRYIAYLNQSGLGLPDRDWYLSGDDETHARAREAYRAYITDLMGLADYGEAERVAESVYSIELPIAEAHWDRVKNRQQELTYNKMSLEELGELAPGIDWAAFLPALGIDETEFVVRQPGFVEAYGTIWSEHSLTQWQDWFSFKLVDAYAAYLSDAFVQTQFDFEGRVLQGTEELRPRWKRGVALIESSMGEVLGKLYVENYFQETAKQRMDELIENLRGAFRAGINELEWMTDATKEQAQDKLRKFTTKIGYPDEWKDYSALTVSPDDLVGNVMRSRQVEHNREVSKLGQPIDRGEWFMTPQTVNAYYNPTMNEIVFPAAILQPPFFNVMADDAVNYGGIGAVIGHEFSHGFDDQGRKYDGQGELNDWWTEEDAEAFSERADALVAQYDAIEVLPGKFLDGEFTLGENIGDLSGLAVAYRAYRMSLNGEEPPVIDGFTGDQRFFIGWAQVWRRLYRDENLEMRITNDPHSFSEARTNNIVRNFDQWYEAFDVQLGDALYLPPRERVKIW